MRKCLRCKADMTENCDIKVEGAGYGVVVAKSERVFADRVGKPKVAVCPECGEISIYIENPKDLSE